MENHGPDEYMGGAISCNKNKIALFTKDRLGLVSVKNLKNDFLDKNVDPFFPSKLLTKQQEIKGVASVCFFFDPFMNQFLAVSTKQKKSIIDIYDKQLAHVKSLSVPENSQILKLETDDNFPNIFYVLTEDNSIYQYNSHFPVIAKVQSNGWNIFPPLNYKYDFGNIPQEKTPQNHCLLTPNLSLIFSSSENVFYLYNSDTNKYTKNDQIQSQAKFWNNSSSPCIVSMPVQHIALVYFPSNDTFVTNGFIQLNVFNNSLIRTKIHQFNNLDLRCILKLSEHELLFIHKNRVIPYQFGYSDFFDGNKFSKEFNFRVNKMNYNDNNVQEDNNEVTQEMINELPKPLNLSKLNEFLDNAISANQFSKFDNLKETINRTECLLNQIKRMEGCYNGVPHLLQGPYKELMLNVKKLQSLIRTMPGHEMKDTSMEEKEMIETAKGYATQYSGFTPNDLNYIKSN